VAAGDFDAARFHRPTFMDNRWLPLEPGTRMVFRGHANDGRDRVTRRIVMTVTDLAKVVNGVRTRVIQELDFTAGALEEREIAFFAQDDSRNVWFFGEYPEEVEEGKIVKTPTWIAGIEGGRPGVFMHADALTGTPSYAEGWGPAVHWNDRARVYRVNQSTCVPVGCFRHVVVVEEFNPGEPGAFQLKYYAPGAGQVRVGWRGPNEEEQEALVLVDRGRLSGVGLERVRSEVLAEERRAYRHSPDVYALTPRIIRPTSA
jgi:hypothetical protein